MKLPGRLYDTKERQFIALYTYFPDVYIAPFSSFENRAKRVAHAAYSEGGKRRGIDVFSLNERVEDLYLVKKSFRGKKEQCIILLKFLKWILEKQDLLIVMRTMKELMKNKI